MTILSIKCLSSQQKWEVLAENILRWETTGCSFILYYKHLEPTEFYLENENAVLRMLLQFRDAIKLLPVKDMSIDVTTFEKPEEEDNGAES